MNYSIDAYGNWVNDNGYMEQPASDYEVAEYLYLIHMMSQAQ